MHEILRHLPAGSFVLDLGCDQGSFNDSEFPYIVCVRVDLDLPRARSKNFVRADASRLPFGREVFDAVICNHSLEHFLELDAALLEIGRVVKRDGAFFASIPDSSSLTDRLYRWLAKGGGHVNQISNVQDLRARIETRIPLQHCATRLTLTSLSFLNSRSPTARPVKTLVDLGIDPEPLLVIATWLTRKLDYSLGTRTSVNGWALYFGTMWEHVDESTWANLCVGCGSGHPSAYLIASRVIAGWRIFRRYSCPCCGATNLFTSDDEVKRIK